MNKPNLFLTVPVATMQQQNELLGRVLRMTCELRRIEAMLSRGVPWNELHASEWREAKRVADRLNEKYGDLSQEDE